MKTAFIFLCLLSGVHPVESVTRVTGYVGGSAVIRCPYDRGYEGYSKYLCRGSCPRVGGKDIPIRTEEGQTKAVNGRFSLHVDTTASLRVFTVTITGLTAQDSGQYWCAIKTGFGKSDKYTEVKLSVSRVLPPSPTWTFLRITEAYTLSPSPSPSPSSVPTSSTLQSDHTMETAISQTTAGKTSEDRMELQDEPEASGSVMLILCTVGLLVVAVMCGGLAYYRLRGKRSKGNVPPSLQNIWPAEEPNDYEMSGEQGGVPEAMAPVITLYSLAGSHQQPPLHSLHSAVSPVSQDLDQPIYCNSKDAVFTIYSNDTA